MRHPSGFGSHSRSSISRRSFAARDRAALVGTVLPYGKGRSILVDECRTRVTDPVLRERFRRYWGLVGPGASYVMGRTGALAKRYAEEADGA